MGITKEEKKAIKLAIDALKKVRRNYAAGKYFYEKYGAETQERQYKEYKKYSEAVETLEGMLK